MQKYDFNNNLVIIISISYLYYICLMRFTILIMSFFCLFSCSEYQAVLKSEDPESKYVQALEYYNNKDYSRSLSLFEQVLTAFNDRDKLENIYYHYVYSTFHIKDYISSSYHFNNFNIKFPASDKREEMAFMSAYCYYMQSPRYNLDQEMTHLAIEQLQLFISTYPNSDRINRASELILNLNKKLEKKDFEIAKSYYETGNFKSAIFAIDNFLNRFPETSYLHDLSFIQIKAYCELGQNSVEEKKEQRIKEAIFACDNFLLAFPSVNYTEEVKAMHQKLKEIQNGL